MCMSVHWQTQYHTTWLKGCREFQKPAGFEPMLPNSAWVQLASTTKPWVHINLPKKTGYDSSYLATLKAWTNFVCAGLSFLHSSSLISRPDKIYQVSWLHTFYQYMFSQQTQIGIQIYSLCTLFDKCSSSSSLTSEKGGLRTWKLEQILRLSHGWLISNPVDDYFEYLIAKKISKSKIKASPVNEAGLYMAFKHFIMLPIWIENHARDGFQAFENHHVK